MKKLLTLLSLISLFSLQLFGGSEAALNKLSPKQISEKVEKAYYFSYPILQGYQALFGISIAKQSPSYFGELNGVYSKPFTLNPSYTAVVSPNADTPYTLLNLDLSTEPMVYSVPAIKNRYYVMQLVDLYGYNAHYIGTRATGTDAGKYLLAGPNWHGKVPKGITKVLRFETDLVLGIGRTQLFGDSDLPALKKVVAQYKVEPLSTFNGTKAPKTKQHNWPVWNPAFLDDERFIPILNFSLSFCKPNPEDAEALANLKSLGIFAGADFDAAKLTKAQQEAIIKGIKTAQAKMAQKARNLSPSQNGWRSLTGFGDRVYFKGDYFLKAAAATVGYLANDPIEASYPVCRVDSEGKQLNGANNYKITFTTEPPNNAFWSVTIYNTLKDGTGGFLVENPINRYLINDKTKGLTKEKDGKMIITISHNEPKDPKERANWLPAPEGNFYLIMRIYMPKESVLNGSWEPPAVTKI